MLEQIIEGRDAIYDPEDEYKVGYVDGIHYVCDILGVKLPDPPEEDE